jgi:hypothetical protein
MCHIDQHHKQEPLPFVHFHSFTKNVRKKDDSQQYQKWRQEDEAEV